MLLLDNSAWSRLSSPELPAERLEQIARLIESRELATCLPFLLEAGYSARSASDYRLLMTDLAALPRFEITPTVESLVMSAQLSLANNGHHRLPPTDLVIAALAHQNQIGVLHYDKDYEILRDHGSLRFESQWLSDRGTL